jgi:hypothetical protein
VWSDSPEVAAYLEHYNTSQDTYRAGLELVDSVADSLLQRDDHPDVVLGSFLANQTTFPLFSDVGRLAGEIGTERFYASLLQTGVDGETQRLLPVSFNLPTIMFSADGANQGLSEFALELEELRTASGNFNEREEERFVRIGFSPRWNSEFLYTVARLYGAGFHESQERLASWDNGALGSAISFLRDWTESTNGGFQSEDAFRQQYLYDPPYQLVLRERIRFAFLDSREYFGFTEEQRDETAFRWVTNDGVVPVREDMVMVGIPAEAQNSAGARDLVEWFYAADTQEELLRMVVSKQLTTFGVVGGFSSFPEINELSLPKVYPSLLGKIPPERMLEAPWIVPKNWGEIKRDVVHDWIGRALSNGSSQGDLEDRIRSWVLQKGE